MLKPDIYFDFRYGKVTELIEDGECKTFQFKNEHGSIFHMFILREIPWQVEGKTYYDIITPYGYGGPIIEEVIGDKNKLVDSFSEAFDQYCLSNNVVSEFVRFHPILENHKNFSRIYHIRYLRKTVGTNLVLSEKPEQTEFSKSTRKIIRQAYRSGVYAEVTLSPLSLNNFQEVYYDTMDRREASEFYFFSPEYFESLLANLKQHILTVDVYHSEKIIASGLYFIYGKIAHAHLSGTKREYLPFSPAYILKDILVKWAKENGIKIIHYGGGVSNANDDSLLLFKKKFSGSTSFDFFIGSKVYKQNIYEKLKEITHTKDIEDFFPAYRYRHE